MTRETLRTRANCVLATTKRAWGIPEPKASCARSALPRLRLTLPHVRGFFFAI
ncbi:hypothetical protein M0765_022760 [Variovorax sp. S2]|uniref:hypothetical protein n=1 Tax=Variovorax sp. S12S4 TaxID=3029170 RepID=UPI00215BCDBF|nr:hypothetical protein [Variovorax sp. S12S4]MCR8960445.1 hypothetical protein [Variovorax sp. S12S4]